MIVDKTEWQKANDLHPSDEGPKNLGSLSITPNWVAVIFLSSFNKLATLTPPYSIVDCCELMQHHKDTLSGRLPTLCVVTI